MDGVKELLQQMYNDNGKLTAGMVLEEARKTDSILHDKFEWDDSVAAEQYRLCQARGIIRKVKIVYKDDPDAKKTVRMFTCIKTNNDSSYVPTVDVARSATMRQIAVSDMMRDWRTFKEKYEVFSEFADLISTENERLNGGE